MSRTYRHNLNGGQLQRGELQLAVREVGIAFGGVRALENVSLDVRQGEIHAVIGPNGAGKTSLLNCTSGLYRPQKGSIVLHDGAGTHELTRTRPSRIARLGVARSFSEHRAVQAHDGARQPHAGTPCAHEAPGVDIARLLRPGA